MEKVSIDSVQYLFADLAASQVEGGRFIIDIPESDLQPTKPAAKKLSEASAFSIFETIQIVIGILTLIILISQLTKQ